MRNAIDLVKGSPGKPLHPPLTDANIGAYTVGVAMLLAGALGLQEEQMAHGSLIAISFGLLLAAPTAITGLLDWLDLPKGEPARSAATIHLFVMVTATVLFAITWLLQRPGSRRPAPRDWSRGSSPSAARSCRRRIAKCCTSPTSRATRCSESSRRCGRSDRRR